ncbi:MAG: FkbM family methyltransferase [Thermoanaerobaculia bacterium]
MNSAVVEMLVWIGTRLGKPPGWERVARTLAPPKRFSKAGDLCVVRDGLLFVAQPTLTLGWNVVMFGTYEPELREIIRTVLSDGGVAVDVGANVGWHTLLMARQVGNAGLVVAVEPNPSVRRRLEAHLDLNRLSQVRVVPCALGEQQGTTDFWGPPAESLSSGDGHLISAQERDTQGVIQVEVRRFDTVFAELSLSRLDLVKIDVEGFEWPVLKGGAETIARFRPQIVFEFNKEYFSRGGGTTDQLEHFFEEHRYRLFAIQRNWGAALEPGDWPENADIWAIPLP